MSGSEWSVAEPVKFTSVRIIGYQQVTDAYLLRLTIRRGGVLAALNHWLSRADQSFTQKDIDAGFPAIQHD